MIIHKKNKSVGLVMLLLLCAINWINSYAQGDLMVTPTRLVMEGENYTEMVNLVNIGKDTAVYSVSFLEYRMTPNGSFEEIETPDTAQFFASKHLRIFPRRFNLAPNVAQTLRVQFRRNPEMAEGEYRSHLYFRDEKKNIPVGMTNENSKDKEGLSIQLTPIYGVTIPAIVRVGNLSVETSITDIRYNKLTNNTIELEFNIERTGTKSSYGDIVIDYIQEDGNEIRVSNLRGISIYTPNTLRQFKFTLNPINGVDLSKGKLRIGYIDNAMKKTTEIFSQKSVNLNE